MPTILGHEVVLDYGDLGVWAGVAAPAPHL